MELALSCYTGLPSIVRGCHGGEFVYKAIVDHIGSYLRRERI